MTDDFLQGESPAETKASSSQTSLASPPATALGLTGPGSATPRAVWGLLDVLPVVLFLLFLAGLSMMSVPEPPPHKTDVRAVLVVQSIFYLMLLLYIYSVVRLKHRLPFWRGLRWPHADAGAVPFLFSGVLLAIFVQMLSLPIRSKLPIERLFANQEAAWLLAAFGTLVAPLVEEVIFRGFIFGAVEVAWGPRTAVWITSLLFATIHVPQLRGGAAQVLAIFLVGLVLSWIRGRTGSLAPPYFVHLAYNATMFTLLFVATHGFREFG